MSDVTTTIDTYLEAYGEPDATRRRKLVSEVFAPDAHLVDPPLDGQGHEGIDAAFGAVQRQFAGHSFRRVSGVDAHHDIARYGWEMVAPDGSVALAGMDVVVLDDAGRLTKVVGFFGELPPREG